VWLGQKVVFQFGVWCMASKGNFRGPQLEYLTVVYVGSIIFSLLFLFTLIPAWFFYSFKTWVGFRSPCLEGLVWLDFANIILIYVFAFLPSIMAVFTLPCLLCFAGAFCRKLVEVTRQ